MNEEHRDTGTGWPEPVAAGDRIEPAAGLAERAAEREPAVEPAAVGPEPAVEPAAVGPEAEPGSDREQAVPVAAGPGRAPWRRPVSSAGALIGVLLALFGFTFAVQLRSNDNDAGLATARQEDLVRILSDLEARQQRLIDDIAELESAQRQLASGVQGRQAALAEAERRANELGLLAGTLPAVGPGLVVRISAGAEPISASAILNTVQELRGAGGEVMQIAGAEGTAVRVVASTAFVDADGGVQVGDVRLTGPYVLTVIGEPHTMAGALKIHGGVVDSISNTGGTVIPESRDTVEVSATREPTQLRYARPVT